MADDRSWRTGVTERTAVYAAFLGGLPLWVPLVAVAAVTAAGLLLGGGAGAVLLLAVAAAAGWLAVLRWDHLTPGGRAVRVLVLTGLVALALRTLG
ncbi:MAG TPA: DUF6703 family protein [Mycobacteriales bacterium]|nr:DUF6703 family protein [Mycobacteriales bacterium]